MYISHASHVTLFDVQFLSLSISPKREYVVLNAHTFNTSIAAYPTGYFSLLQETIYIEFIYLNDQCKFLALSDLITLWLT